MPYPPPTMNLRTTLGRPLAFAEEDANFSGLASWATVVGQLFNPDGSLDPTILQQAIANYLATSFANSPFLQQVGDVKWTPLQIPSAMLSAQTGAIWVALDGSKKLQTAYPKLFTYLGHVFDNYTNVVSGTIQNAGGVGLATFAIANGGSGYAVNDILTIAGGTFTTAAQVKVITVANGGVITYAQIINNGLYTVNPSSPNTPTGGTGTGASLTLTMSGYQVNDILGVAGGSGSAARFKVTSVSGAGAITGISLLASGAYSAAPSTPNTVTGGSGFGATLNLNFPLAVNAPTEFRLPTTQGLFLFGADTETVAGSISGEKTHALSAGELASHSHNLHTLRVQHGTTDTTVYTPAVNDSAQGADTPSPTAGSGTAHNTMPPNLAGYFYILAGYMNNGVWL